MYIRNQKISSRELEGSAVLVDPDEKELIELNPVATEIWRLMDGGNSVEDIAAHVCETFDVSPKKAMKDVTRFVKRLLDMEVIVERK